MSTGKPAGILMLTHDEQVQAIRRMAASGMSVYTIAAATALSVEMIQEIGEQAPVQ